MPARTPRRSFAAPFVITLAAAPACHVQTSTMPPPQQPTQTAQPSTQEPAPSPSPVIANPPRPTTTPATPAPAPANTRWTIFKAEDGSCMAAVKVECVQGATCNPPPPQKYECPTGVSLDSPQTVVSNADGSACQIEYPKTQCPPNVACNPPRPRPVACPR